MIRIIVLHILLITSLVVFVKISSINYVMVNMSEYLTFLAACSAALFTVVGIWIALIFPGYLDLIKEKKEAKVVLSRILDNKMESSSYSLALLFRAMIFSTLVILLVMALKFLVLFPSVISNSIFIDTLFMIVVLASLWQMASYCWVFYCVLLILNSVENEIKIVNIEKDV